jgi:hypothetical protein
MNVVFCSLLKLQKLNINSYFYDGTGNIFVGTGAKIC